MVTVARETQQGSPRNIQSRNSTVPRINEEYITQVSEESEDRVTDTLSLEFKRTESQSLGALSKLDEFSLASPVPSGTVPGASYRNMNAENQEPTEGADIVP